MTSAASSSVDEVARIGKYRLLGKLGEGGMAEVFVGVADHAPGFHKLLVLKLLRESLAEDPDCVTMFLDEARLAARLSHRNVVQTYEVGQTGTRYAIVMEFLEGASLSRLRRLAIARHAPLSLACGVHVLTEALAGLHYAHDLTDYDGAPLELVHRDFTPANIVVTLDGQVKVLDFGIAKTRANVGQTRTGMLKGTARYMAPEAVLGQPIDRRTDVYMAGAMLWELATGQRPWFGKEGVAVLHSVAGDRLPPIRSIAPELPERFEEIVLTATAPDRDARYPTAQALREALLAFIRHSDLHYGPDALAAMVADLSGDECRARKERIDLQLSKETTGESLIGQTSLPSLEAPTGSHVSQHAPPKRRLWPAAAVIGLVVVTAGVTAALQSGDEETESVAPAPTAVVVEPAVPPDPTTTNTILVRVSATPEHASITLDGRALQGNPAEIRAERDGQLHLLRVEASGHVAETMNVRFDGDVRVALSLPRRSRPVRRAARRTRTTMRPAPTPPPAPEPAAPAPTPMAETTTRSDAPRELDLSRPAPMRDPARTIDTDNPWGD